MQPRKARTLYLSSTLLFARSNSTGAASTVIHSPSSRLAASCSSGSLALAAAPTVCSALAPPMA